MPGFEHRGARIVYDDSGSGPAVVFIHGHPFNRRMWDAQCAFAASAGWRAIAADLRGYGESSPVSGKTPLATFVDDVKALLDHLGVGEAVLVGLSMGGQIAMGFTATHPIRVRGLVLAATFAQAETEDQKDKRRAAADRFEHGGEPWRRYIDTLLPGMLAPETFAHRPDIVAFVEGMMRATDPASAAAAMRGRADRGSDEATLAAFSRPALIVVGDRDGFTTVADGQAMATLMPQARLSIMPGVGHMPNLEAQDAFNAELGDFLKRAVPLPANGHSHAMDQDRC